MGRVLPFEGRLARDCVVLRFDRATVAPRGSTPREDGPSEIIIFPLRSPATIVGMAAFT